MKHTLISFKKHVSIQIINRILLSIVVTCSLFSSEEADGKNNKIKRVTVTKAQFIYIHCSQSDAFHIRLRESTLCSPMCFFFLGVLSPHFASIAQTHKMLTNAKG